MENTTAMKMRELATAYHEQLEAEMQEKANHFVETFIIKEIEESAKAGNFSLNRHVSVPMRPYVKKILEEMGFTVDKGINNTFDIKW